VILRFYGSDFAGTQGERSSDPKIVIHSPNYCHEASRKKRQSIRPQPDANFTLVIEKHVCASPAVRRTSRQTRVVGISAAGKNAMAFEVKSSLAAVLPSIMKPPTRTTRIKLLRSLDYSCPPRQTIKPTLAMREPSTQDVLSPNAPRGIVAKIPHWLIFLLLEGPPFHLHIRTQWNAGPTAARRGLRPSGDFTWSVHTD
jgi:hypothetical protein